jgi:hypothetical protein
MTKKEKGPIISQRQFLGEARIEIESALNILNQFNRDTVEPQLIGMGAVETARFMSELMQANEAAEELKSTIGKVYDWVRTAAVPEKMDEEGLELLRIEGVGRVSLTSDVNVAVIDKDESFKWLESSGHGDMITETVNASSLKALLRRLIRDGKEIPEAIYRVTPFTRASITKS